MNELINMRQISKTYTGKTYVLKDLSFNLKKGEVVTIMGASGCGKSTFLNIVGLLDNASSGEFYFDGTQIEQTKLNSYYLQRARDIGFIFQAYCLIDSITVKENILMPFLYNDSFIDKKILEKMQSLLAELNLTSLIDKKVALLSGGERQRVAIARAVLKQPQLIIADEPTGNLDEANAQLVVNAFNSIAQRGTAIIVVTHNKSLSFETGTAYVLQEGELINC